MNNELNKIESLLNDDIELEKYITSIENTNTTIPYNLENDLLNHFSNKSLSKKDNIKQAFITNIFKILKICACTIMALSMWNILGQSPLDINEDNSKAKEIRSSIIQGLEQANNFLLTPIEKERIEK